MTSVALSGIAELGSRAVQLRPLLPSDGEWCYALMCGPAGSRWRYRGRTPAPEVVAADLWRGVFAQFVVTDRRDGRPAGLVGFYNVAPDAGRAHAFALAEPDSSSLVTEGFGLLCAWGFDQFVFERIFIEAPEFNVAAFASLGDAAIVEGRLRNYEMWRGRYWDQLIMSITPEAFHRRFGDLLAARRSASAVSNRSVNPATDEFVATVVEMWPLDSLGVVEVLAALEETVGVPVPNEVLDGIDVDDPITFATALLSRAGVPAVDVSLDTTEPTSGRGQRPQPAR